MPKNWIVVASAEHVARGQQDGFVQACHGKRASLLRMTAGDFVVCYSPTTAFGGADKLRSFTAFGVVGNGDPYPVRMRPDFTPYRRDIRWLPSRAAPIASLLDALAFTSGLRNWGYRFRFGILEISGEDMALIGHAMNDVEGGRGMDSPDSPCDGVVTGDH